MSPIALVCAMLLAPISEVYAQSRDEEVAEGEICLPVLRVWNGTPAEVKAIKATPIPLSFKEGIQACGGPLRARDLIDWHLRFGTEETAFAAVNYIADRHAEYRPQVRKAAKDIDRVMAQIVEAARRSNSGAEKSADKQQILLTEKLYRPMAHLSSPLEVADIALSAADRFSSTRLRNLASSWIDEYDQLRAKIAFPGTASAAAKARFDEFTTDDGMDFMRTELRIRAALFDAQQTLSFEDVAHAVRMGQQQRTEGLMAVAENAFEGGTDFCDLPDYAPQVAKDACATGNFERRAKRLMYLDAIATVLSGEFSPAERFLEIYDRDPKNNGDWDTRWTGIDPRIVKLKVIMAESRYRSAASESGGPDMDEMSYALDELTAVTRLFSPAEDPVGFRRIALSALHKDQELIMLAVNAGDKPYSRFAPTMSLYRVVLSRLDDIASGSISGLPPDQNALIANVSFLPLRSQ
ncbi:MAG: hypothetical protein JHD35_03400 [Sphingopyxis sp.]|nr:hypothetical protein [Sphingopyxis sp.]